MKNKKRTNENSPESISKKQCFISSFFNAKKEIVEPSTASNSKKRKLESSIVDCTEELDVSENINSKSTVANHSADLNLKGKSPLRDISQVQLDSEKKIDLEKKIDSEKEIAGSSSISTVEEKDTKLEPVHTVEEQTQVPSKEILQLHKSEEKTLHVQKETLQVEQEKTPQVEEDKTLQLEQEKTLQVEEEKALQLEQEKTLEVEQEKTPQSGEENTVQVEEDKTLQSEQEKTIQVEEEKTIKAKKKTPKAKEKTQCSGKKNKASRTMPSRAAKTSPGVATFMMEEMERSSAKKKGTKKKAVKKAPKTPKSTKKAQGDKVEHTPIRHFLPRTPNGAMKNTVNSATPKTPNAANANTPSSAVIHNTPTGSSAMIYNTPTGNRTMIHDTPTNSSAMIQSTPGNRTMIQSTPTSNGTMIQSTPTSNSAVVKKTPGSSSAAKKKPTTLHQMTSDMVGELLSLPAALPSNQEKVEMYQKTVKGLLEMTMDEDLGLGIGKGLQLMQEEADALFQRIEKETPEEQMKTDFPHFLSSFFARILQGSQKTIAEILVEVGLALELIRKWKPSMNCVWTDTQIEMQVRKLAQRVPYGHKGKEADVYNNSATISLWYWDVMHTEIYFSPIEHRVIREMRTKRKRYGNYLKNMLHVIFLLQQTEPNAAKLSSFEAKISSFEAVEEAARVKKAKKEHQEALRREEKEVKKQEEMARQEKDKVDAERLAGEKAEEERQGHKSITMFFNSASKVKPERATPIKLSSQETGLIDLSVPAPTEESVIKNLDLKLQEHPTIISSSTIYATSKRPSGRRPKRQGKAIVYKFTENGQVMVNERMKFLQFSGSYRPAYFGTHRASPREKHSIILHCRYGRRPFSQSTLLDYEIDSDEEWELEDEIGESLSGAEDGDEEGECDDELDYEDKWLAYENEVEYLENADEATQDENQMLPHDKQKVTANNKPSAVLKPMQVVVVGPCVIPGNTMLSEQASIFNELQQFEIRIIRAPVWKVVEPEPTPATPAPISEPSTKPTPPSITSFFKNAVTSPAFQKPPPSRITIPTCNETIEIIDTPIHAMDSTKDILTDQTSISFQSNSAKDTAPDSKCLIEASSNCPDKENIMSNKPASTLVKTLSDTAVYAAKVVSDQVADAGKGLNDQVAVAGKGLNDQTAQKGTTVSTIAVVTKPTALPASPIIIIE